MNRPEHMLAGSLVSTGTYLAIKKNQTEQPTISGILLSIGAGSLISILPDLLEPATSSFHRNFFHSITFASIAGYLLYKALNDDNIDIELKMILSIISSSYGSHLLLDGFTSRGLPLVYNKF